MQFDEFNEEANLNVFQYTGREGTYTQDASAGAQWPGSVRGVYHYRSRDYLPELAQFARQDDLRTWNRYTYVDGNPVNWVDPWGEDAQAYADCMKAAGLWYQGGDVSGYIGYGLLGRNAGIRVVTGVSWGFTSGGILGAGALAWARVGMYGVGYAMENDCDKYLTEKEEKEEDKGDTNSTTNPENSDEGADPGEGSGWEAGSAENDGSSVNDEPIPLTNKLGYYPPMHQEDRYARTIRRLDRCPMGLS